MIFAALVALSLAVPDKKVPVGDRHGSHLRESRRLGGRSGSPQQPVFRFAPSTGAGMTEECACTSPTGTRGEALTFARASSAMCTKGNEWSSIDNGDLVLCSTDQPRVMRGGTGGGAKGLMVESARTNSVLRSQELENASWGNAGTAPVVRTDHGVAPDGTTTAEAIQFLAVGGGGESSKFQSGLGTLSPGACSVYLKAAPPADGGVAVAGSIDMAAGAAANPCVTCSYTTDTWTRCTLTGNTSTYVFIGNESAGACAGGARTEQNVYVWGVQCEAGDYTSSYIPTTNATATRAQEDATFTLANTYSAATGYSMSAKFTLNGAASATTSGPASIGQDATNNLRQALATNSTVGTCGYLSTGASGTSSATSTPLVKDGDNRKICTWTGATTTQRQSTYNGVASTVGTTGAASSWDWSGVKLQGEYTDATFGATRRRPDGVVKEVCVHNAPTKCQDL